MALFAKGRVEFADLFEEHELAARPHLIDAHTFLVYEKQIRNLQLQEARLVRRREKETAELRALQQQRQQQEQECANGFEFSTPGKDGSLEGITAFPVGGQPLKQPFHEQAAISRAA
jgi:hypothetical protein